MQKLKYENPNNEILDLTSGHFGITNWSGLSETSLNVQSQTVPFQDGAVYLDALIQERDISVTVAINDEGNLENRYKYRRELISKMNPKLGEGYLIYENDFLSKRIKVIPQLPTIPNKNSDTVGTLKASLTFTAVNPYWEDLEETTINIDTATKKKLINSGDIPTSITVDIFPSEIKNPKILNLATKSSIELEGTFNKNIHIDTNIGKKNIYQSDYVFTTKEILEDLNDIKYVEYLGKYIAVGDKLILSSDDGEKWIVHDVPYSGYKKIAYSNELKTILIICNVSEVLYLRDLSSYEAVPLYRNIYDITYLNNMFIASCNKAILTSGTGLRWEERYYSSSRNIKKIYYTLDNKYLIISSRQGNVYPILEIYSSTDLLQLTKLYEFPEMQYSNINYLDSLGLYLISNYNNETYYSTNGSEWTVSDIPSFNAVTYNKYSKQYIAINSIYSENDTKIYSSLDGINWTQKNIFAKHLSSIYYNSQLKEFVSVGINGIILKFSDINSLEQITGNFNMGEIYDILYDGDDVLYSTNKGVYLYRNDNLTQVFSSATILKSKIMKSDIKILVMTSGGFLSSTNKTDWEDIQSWRLDVAFTYSGFYSEKLDKFIFGAQFFGAIRVGYIERIYNQQGLRDEHTSLKDEGATIITNVCYSEDFDLFVAIGNEIFTSTDTKNWTKRTSLNLGNYGRGFVYYYPELKIFIASYAYKTLVSQNGIYWTVIPKIGEISNGGIPPKYIPELKQLIQPVNGGFYYSFDGFNWGKVNIGGNLNYVEYKDNKLIFYGNTIQEQDELSEQVSIIDKITPDSDMGLNLKQGENEFILSSDSGQANATIRYRNKYIGV